MKKKLLAAGCLVAFGLLLNGLSAVTASAKENVGLVSGPMTRATVVRQVFTLGSGDYNYIRISTTNKANFASKVLVKVKAENPNNDYFGLHHNGKKDEVIFTSNSVEEYKFSAATNSSQNQTEYIYISNYSAVPIKFTIGYTMGIHMKSIPCIDYSDIDFNL
ncbi:hypothetical protein ACWOC1_04015 [Enterococcus quebecensis]|uniref:DUF4352 domain-containing protein n=1 Tax=Enterococcus quebecensis TaxID=903983 RepID=A0A1E5GX04_9ENTE|nr:hypothetical protein [Enterococcus quebecensis]OEG17199.1 hypothetical protein BCR23_04125 [Enterococcus quebecensis]OJG75591.1 hypothetical protein RV12_GL001394 [Enterococcus quebecensis]